MKEKRKFEKFLSLVSKYMSTNFTSGDDIAPSVEAMSRQLSGGQKKYTSKQSFSFKGLMEFVLVILSKVYLKTPGKDKIITPPRYLEHMIYSPDMGGGEP